MKIIDAKTPLEDGIFTKVVIGKFDGVHLGHRKLIKAMTEHEDDLKSLVFTFDLDSPISFNSGYIYSKEERRSFFEELGADYLVEFYLDKESAAMSPEDFVREVLVNRLHAKAVFCGPDLSFGKKGAGNTKTIKALGPELGIELFVIEKERYRGEDISSTRIRESIARGNTGEAVEMLGRNVAGNLR